ncbi:MAG: putative quinol monooxygenase [Pseudomonadota bacterium]
MICVAGEMVIAEKDIEAARAAAIDMMDETAKEDGCIHYRFYQDVQHPTKFHVYEEWESPAHLAAHAKSDHMKVFRAALSELTVESRDIAMFEMGEKKSV